MVARSCFSLFHDFSFSMLDLVAQVNHSILTSVLLKCNDYALYLVGLFLEHTASKIQEVGRKQDTFFGAARLTIMAQEISQDEDGEPHPLDIIVEKRWRLSLNASNPCYIESCTLSKGNLVNH